MGEQRYQAVMAVLGGGRTVTEVARDWEVSRQTLHAWLARYERTGMEGMGDDRSPTGCPQQMPALIECGCWRCGATSRSVARADWSWSWPRKA